MGRSKAGFTLIELLVVVVIVAILAAIALPNLLEAQVRSKVARVKSDHRTLATAIESYAVDHNRYPPEDHPYVPGLQVAPDINLSLVRLTTPVAYLSSLPADPLMLRARQELRDGTQRDLDHGFYVEYTSFGSLRGVGAGPRFHGWGISSLGADHRDDGILWSPFNFARFGGAHLPSAVLRVYDPTNGTVSAGDIARFGGMQPAAVQTVASSNS